MNELERDIAEECHKYDSDEVYFRLEANIEKWLRKQGFGVFCDHLSGTDAWVAAIEAQVKADLERKEENAWDIN